MPETPQSFVQPAAPVPPAASPFVPPPPAPPRGSKHGCVEIALIIFATVVCTIIVEIVLGFFAISYLAKHVWQSVQNEFMPSATTTEQLPANSSSSGSGSTALTKQQAQLLQSLGLSPSSLPAGLTPTKITCITNAIGADRIAAIMSGKATPGISDLLNARGCL